MGDSENRFFESLHSATHTHLQCEYSLIILGKNELEISSSILVRNKNSLSKYNLELFKSTSPILGSLSREQRQELFLQNSEKSRSFAVVPIRDNQKEIALFTLRS